MPEGMYVSRSLGESGEMGKVSGTSGWRAFRLPFDPSGASGAPTRLEFNMVLPGQGVVFVGPVKLVEYSDGPSGASSPPVGAWWSDRMAGAVFGFGGGGLGCLACLLAGLASRGRSRALVVGLSLGLIGLGAVAVLLGLVALALRQPYGVWFPLLAIGVLVTSVLPFRLKQFQKQYQELELRRMVAIDG